VGKVRVVGKDVSYHSWNRQGRTENKYQPLPTHRSIIMTLEELFYQVQCEYISCVNSPSYEAGNIEVSIDDGDYHKEAGLLLYIQRNGHREELRYIEVGR